MYTHTQHSSQHTVAVTDTGKLYQWGEVHTLTPHKKDGLLQDYVAGTGVKMTGMTNGYNDFYAYTHVSSIHSSPHT